MNDTENTLESVQAVVDLEHISLLNTELTTKYKHWLIPQPALNRTLVSFQANKSRAVYRWYKYKEGFSADLVTYFLNGLELAAPARLLDPFAGSGTTLFVGSEQGMAADGIELLPIGQEIMAARQIVETGLTDIELRKLSQWADTNPWEKADGSPLPELRITQGAYPELTYKHISGYLACINEEAPRLKTLLRFALLCVLESVSYTRKDGQYLRWDYRSNRRQGASTFDKGTILPFTQAIQSKLKEILHDLADKPVPTDLFTDDSKPKGDKGKVSVLNGSCLDILSTLEESVYDGIITSPPYCNRYDYTRTYALELALLGVDEVGIVALRQAMLSCTVENRPKELTELNPSWKFAIQATDSQELLQSILTYLENERLEKRLNNAGISRMVKGYFYEMACVIQECGRVLKPGAPIVMVNDNVRFAGANISVDLILSDIAHQLGFDVEAIYVLPGAKGNSSQQMGLHGREAMRKCVYVWKKKLQ
jgi:DNA modification methylase